MLFATPGNETKPKPNPNAGEKEKTKPTGTEGEKNRKRNEKKKKKSLCKKKIKICRLSFITITFFFCTEKHLMGGGVALPGVRAGGQVRAPPAVALLPAPESPGEGIPEPPPHSAARSGTCCCGFEFPSLRVSPSLEKGQSGEGLRGQGTPRQTRVALSARKGQSRSQLVCTGVGWGVGAVLPNVSCLPLTSISFYTEISRCAGACTYGGVCI